MVTPVRTWHAAIAVFVTAALLLQTWIAIRVAGHPPGHEVGTLRGTGLGWRIGRVFSFFTVQSNLLAAVASATLAAVPARDGTLWRVLRLDALFGITVTGIVYSTVIARYHQPNGWQETAVNTTLHYIVPVMMVVGWLLFGPRPRITGRTLLTALIWPAGYLVYILLQGHYSKWYPYPFLDVITQGYARVLGNVVAVLAVLAVVGALFLLGDRKLPPAPRRTDDRVETPPAVSEIR